MSTPNCRPAAINSEPYQGRSGCRYHGFCDRGGCHVDAKNSTAVTTIPRAEATGNLEIGFIPADTLASWQEWVAGFLARDFTWERLRFMARRIASGDDQHPAHQVADEFLRAMPESLDRLFEQIPYGCVDGYRERTTERLTQAIGDYLV